MKKLGILLSLTLAIALFGGIAQAQNVGDNSVYFVTYYSNAFATGAPDETVRIINDGDTGGNLWASFYVFDDSEELSECCSCEITPDGILSESVNGQLLANPLTGRKNHIGVIKVVSSSTGLAGTHNTPVAGLRGWSTHTQRGGAPGTYSTTETRLADSNLTSGENTILQNLCSFAIQLGSGTGVCSCTPEDHNF
jgi:hypothetical protein